MKMQINLFFLVTGAMSCTDGDTGQEICTDDEVCDWDKEALEPICLPLCLPSDGRVCERCPFDHRHGICLDGGICDDGICKPHQKNVAELTGGKQLPTKEIAPGVNLPVVNIGTWLAGSKTEDPHLITKNWLAQGFRGIDTALIYNDQKDIAAAIEESGIPREEIFITSKLPGCAAAAASVDADLKQLNVDYIDLMLIHSPIGLSCPNTWKVLEDYVAQGKLKSIGVSNFNVKQMQKIMDMATVPIAVNQIQYNVFSHDEEIISFCDANNITVEAYSPLSGAKGAQSVFKDETVKAVADAHNVSAAQVALRWIVQRGHTLAVLTSSAEHQASDADLWSFELADDEMDTLTQRQNNALVV